MCYQAKLSNTSNDSDKIDSKHNMESSFYMYEMPQVLTHPLLHEFI